MNIKETYLILLILTIFGCQNYEKKENLLVQKEFGKFRKDSDSLSVELNLKKFNNWNELIERAERISCNDSVPKITLKTEKTSKTIYFQNPCWEKFACILIKEKNVIEIHNNKISKNSGELYTLDSLKNILKRDFENNGKNPSLSDNPEKLLIQISYDKNEFKNFEKTLEKLIETYEEIAKKRNINIWLNEKIEIIPLTKPPPPIPLY
ncbi:hypothetical protein GCM10011416_14260 [Polaribacter pacificus]|uniref:Lipoprotein n=1 Tax=Polaribacter pacificus TaxID=1775173 RepID=A0A917HZK7_9FLAO|nr:hypothetical protein [Polaribacter pacificus]GGG97413.1 hypothetical protein GCM10011416_14260 [Polaribacter pacificus]